jgi:hypothetical protein
MTPILAVKASYWAEGDSLALWEIPASPVPAG